MSTAEILLFHSLCPARGKTWPCSEGLAPCVRPKDATCLRRWRSRSRSRYPPSPAHQRRSLQPRRTRSPRWLCPLFPAAGGRDPAPVDLEASGHQVRCAALFRCFGHVTCPLHRASCLGKRRGRVRPCHRGVQRGACSVPRGRLQMNMAAPSPVGERERGWESRGGCARSLPMCKEWM